MIRKLILEENIKMKLDKDYNYIIRLEPNNISPDGEYNMYDRKNGLYLGTLNSKKNILTISSTLLNSKG